MNTLKVYLSKEQWGRVYTTADADVQAEIARQQPELVPAADSFETKNRLSEKKPHNKPAHHTK